MEEGFIISQADEIMLTVLSCRFFKNPKLSMCQLGTLFFAISQTFFQLLVVRVFFFLLSYPFI